MKLIHKRDKIREAKHQWLAQYARHKDSDRLGWDQSRTFGSVREALGAIDTDKCSDADIDKAIGVTGWAKNECDDCVY